MVTIKFKVHCFREVIMIMKRKFFKSCGQLSKPEILILKMTVDYGIAKQILSDEFVRLLKVETLDQGSDKSILLL